MKADTCRIAVLIALDDRGWEPKVAQRVALALHPLDDGVRTTRRYRKGSREAATSLALGLRGMTENDALLAATNTLRLHKTLAAASNDSYYVTRYDTVLADLLSPEEGEAVVNRTMRDILSRALSEEEAS